MNRLEKFYKHDLFFELTQKEIDMFQKIGQTKTYDEGAILFYEQDVAHSFYIILSGFVKGGIFENKKEKLFHYFFPNMLIGEISFLEQKNYALSAKFVTAGKAIVISKASLENSNFSKEELNKIFQRAMISKVRFLQRSINTITSINGKVKCAIFLLEHQHYMQFISINEMSSILNTTRESVSRALRFFIECKAIKKDKNTIYITNALFLENFIIAQENGIPYI